MPQSLCLGFQYLLTSPQQEEMAAGGGAEGGSVEGADYSSLGSRPKVRKQRPEEIVVPQSLAISCL